MGLFKKTKQPLPDLMTETDYDEVANFSSAVSYLEGLSADEYAKVIKIAEICRKSNLTVANTLGEPLQPTSFINPSKRTPEPGEVTEPDFLDDIAPNKPKPKKVEVQ